MEPIKEEDMNFFIFMSCQGKMTNPTKASIAVIQAMLFSEGAINLEKINENAFVFSTIKTYDEIKKKLNRTKIQFLLIDIGVLYDLEHISGTGPNINLQIFKDISSQKFSKIKPRLQSIASNSLNIENFELAAKLRDINKQQQ